MPQQTSIDDIGLEKHLNLTKDEHNGRGFREFRDMIDFYVSIGKKPNKTLIAEAFNVNRATIKKWLDKMSDV